MKALFYEKSLLVFLFLSFFLGLCFKFYKVPFYLFIIPLFILSEIWSNRSITKKKHFLIFGFLIFLLGYFYLTAYIKLKITSYKAPQGTFETFFKVEKVEPYYGKYKVWIDTSQGTYTFLTEKKLFTPGKFCLAYFKEKRFKKYLNPFSPLKTELFFIQGIEGELKLLDDRPVVCEEASGFNLENLRFQLFEFSEKLPPLSKALFQTLVLGVHRGLPPQYLERLKTQGLYHLLAISGFHLGVLFGIFYFFWRGVFGVLAIRNSFFQPVQLFASLCALPGAFLMLLFSGFAPSAERAFFFLFLFVVSRLLFRNTSSLSLLCLTALLLLIFKPTYVGSFSFLLSFLATFALIIGGRAARLLAAVLNLNSADFWKKRIFNIFQAILASFAVSLLIFPLILFIDGSFPIGTPLNNLIAGAFWGFVFIPLSIFSALLSFINQDLALKTALFLGKTFSFYSKLPFWEYQLSFSLPVNLIISLCILTPILMFFLWRRKKTLISAVLTTTVCLVAFYFVFLFFYLKIPMITVFDVGKGDAILIKVPSKESSYYVLWDTGPNFGKKSGFNWTKFYLVPVLKKLGVNAFDLIAVSHPDLDHSGGFSTIKKCFFIEEEITSEFPEACWSKVNLNEPLSYLIEPEVKKFGEAELFLYPGKVEHLLSFKKPCEHLNSESLVGVLEYKGFTMILPGDIDVSRFSRLIYEKKIFPAEVLLSPHHGSKTGLNSFVLKAVKPKTVLISGRGRFHPHPVILRLFRKEKLPYFVTASSGAIYVFPQKKSFLVCEERKRREDFWARLLFPLFPYYWDTMGCYRFNYHFAKGV